MSYPAGTTDLLEMHKRCRGLHVTQSMANRAAPLTPYSTDSKQLTIRIESRLLAVYVQCKL